MTRTFAYVRVSKERDGLISPEMQQDEIARHCARKGWTVTETYTDIDLSGKLPPEKRPGLQELLTRARAGECDMVVVYRVDRLSREPADYYAILSLLREAGVGIDAAAQPREAGPEGELLWDLSAVLARYESLKLGARLKDMHRRLAREGRWSGGIVPYGWRRVKDAGGTRLILEPEEARHRRWMHERYHSGWSCLRIARALNAQQAPTRKGGVWHDGLVWHMLRSPYQAGARRTETGLATGGNVEPLLTEEEYERTLALMKARHSRRGRVGTHAIPARLCRCGTCGGPLVAGSMSGGDGVYECAHRKQGTCDRGVSIRYRILEPYVIAHLFRRLRGTRGKRPSPMLPDITPLLDDLERAREALGQLALMRAQGDLSESEFASARTLQRKKLAHLETQIERATVDLERGAKEQMLDEAWSDLGALTEATWDTLSVEARRDILDLVIERIVVDPADGHAPKQFRPERRVRIRWR